MVSSLLRGKNQLLDEMLLLPGLGAPGQDGGDPGDLYVTIRVRG
ncbi:hypothetical protein [Streptomyces sp. NPDC047315]